MIPALAITEPVSATPQPIRGRCLTEIGGERNASGLAEPMVASASRIFAPRGACIHPQDGSLWISDTGHHRVLGWRNPLGNNAASQVIGHPDFQGDGRNAGDAVCASSMNVPTGLCAYGSGLAVADAWNHRVLIWRNLPTETGQPADIVLGQEDFNSDTPNRGQTAPDAGGMHWPFGLLVHDGHLYVADTGNRRVLIWETLPEHSGQPADRVIGQVDFMRRDENGGAAVSSASMRWPHALAIWQGRLCVADAGNNRIMVYATELPATGSGCQYVLGQADKGGSAHMRGRMATAADALNMPYGLASSGDWLIATDTASSRLLAWYVDALCDGAAANGLCGQLSFSQQGDNAWGEVTTNSLCWPYAVAVHERWLITCDTGNSRVLLHELAL